MDDILNLIFSGNVKTISKTFTESVFGKNDIDIKINEVNKLLDKMVIEHTYTLADSEMFITSQNQTMIYDAVDLATSQKIVISRVVTYLVIRRS